MDPNNVSNNCPLLCVYEYALTLSGMVSGRAWIKILSCLGVHFFNRFVCTCSTPVSEKVSGYSVESSP